MELTNENNSDIRPFGEVYSLTKTRSRVTENITTFRVAHASLRRHFRLDSSERRDGVFFLAIAGPPAEWRTTIVRQWSNDCDRTEILVQGQRLAIILQQDHRSARDFTRETNTLRTQQRRWLTCLIRVRTIEEAESKFDAQNTSHRLVDRGGGEFVLLQELWAKLVVAAAHHLHVDARVERRRRSLLLIRSDAVIDQLTHRRVIADDETIKLPLVAQHLRKRESIRRSRNTVDCVERTHQRACARIDGGLKRRQVDLTQ